MKKTTIDFTEGQCYTAPQAFVVQTSATNCFLTGSLNTENYEEEEINWEEE